MKGEIIEKNDNIYSIKITDMYWREKVTDMVQVTSEKVYEIGSEIGVVFNKDKEPYLRDLNKYTVFGQ